MSAFEYGLAATYLGLGVYCLGSVVAPQHACHAYRLTQAGAFLSCLGLIVTVVAE